MWNTLCTIGKKIKFTLQGHRESYQKIRYAQNTTEKLLGNLPDPLKVDV